LPRPIHLKNRKRPKPKPREVRGPGGISGLQGLETVVPPINITDDPTRVVEVRNELTGQVWNFKDVGSMLGPNGAFMLRGHWDPGIYRIENRTNASLRLTLWNESHDILPGETWRFAAHSEIGRQAEMIEKRRLH